MNVYIKFGAFVNCIYIKFNVLYNHQQEQKKQTTGTDRTTQANEDIGNRIRLIEKF